MKTFEQLIKEHGIWADATFPKGTAQGALIHGMREAHEVILDFEEMASKESKAVELSDFLGCIFDAGRRFGVDTKTVARMLDYLCDTSVTLIDVRNAFDLKLQINKGRTWKDNGDGSYSHVK